MEVDVVARVGCRLGEGPIWDPGRAVVMWVDIHAGRVWECALGGSPTVAVEHHEPLGAIALATGGALVGFTPTGLWRLDAERSSVLIENPEIDPALRANDGKPDPAGRFVGGTMGFPAARDGAGTLWSFADGTARPLLRGTTISNGLAWSADGSTMYYVDTPTRTIRAFPYDLATGELGAPAVFVTVAEESGDPDGLTIDAEGGVWVALWGGGAVRRYAPDGSLSEVVEVPARYPTCPVFAGPDLDVLVVTSATEAYEPGSEPPGAGDVYACAPGVTGVAAHTVSL